MSILKALAGPLTGGVFNMLGGFLNRRSEKKARRRNINEALAAGVNPILVYGGAAAPGSGISPMGNSLASAGQSVGRGIEEYLNDIKEREERTERDEKEQMRALLAEERRMHHAKEMQSREHEFRRQLAAENNAWRSMVSLSAGNAASRSARANAVGKAAAERSGGIALPGMMGVTIEPNKDVRRTRQSPSHKPVEPPATEGEAGELIYGVRNFVDRNMHVVADDVMRALFGKDYLRDMKSTGKWTARYWKNRGRMPRRQEYDGGPFAP